MLAGATSTLPAISITATSVDAAITVHALDEQPIVSAKRLLVVIATDALNSGMAFTDATRTGLLSIGNAPCLVRAGKFSLTVSNTHAAGIINRVNFIAGYFHETDEDVDATIRLVETLATEIDIVGCFQGFYLFPGMGVDEAATGITLRPGLDKLKSGQTTLGYDEIGGLTWEVKRDTIDASPH